MKKKIEADLISIAHRILQLKDHTTLSELQEEARQLYEKLAILNFAESHFTGPQPTIGQVRAVLEEFPEPTVPESAIAETITKTSEENAALETITTTKNSIPFEKETTSPKTVAEEPTSETQNGITYKEQTGVPKTEETATTQRTEATTKDLFKTPSETLEDKPEFVIDEVNAAISEDLFVPATAEEINAILRGETVEKSPVGTSDYQKNDLRDVTPNMVTDTDRPKSLNDSLKKNINIGLNDRLAFIKHLFDGNSADYNRVLSQLNTIDSSEEAIAFIQTHIKPDHNNWEDKQEYEDRFMQIVSAKFD